MMKRILYLEENHIESKNVSKYLQNFYYIDAIYEDRDIFLYLYQYHYDIIILDINQFKYIERIQEYNNDIYIIVTTEDTSVEKKINNLINDIDIYMIKPFDVRELYANIKALLRRKYPEKIYYEDITFHIQSQQIYYDNKMILLTQKENKLLFFLLNNKNKLFTSQELVYALYPHPDDILPNTIAVTISKIRKKIPIELIKTFQTRGYMIEVSF